jgi:hypothetical protein
MHAVYEKRNAEYTHPMVVGGMPYSSMIRESPAVEMLILLMWLIIAIAIKSGTIPRWAEGEPPRSVA